jgi:hypothetical protein
MEIWKSRSRNDFPLDLMTYQHLKDPSYYEEMYDKFTVDWCRRFEEPRAISDDELKELKEFSLSQIQWCHDLVTDSVIFQEVGDRYLRKEETIQGWMERDKRRDQMVERARAPLIRCPSCGKAMECVYTDVRSDIDSDREWLEFFLCCKPCKQGKDVYENGSEVPRKPVLCEKCKREVETDIKKKNGKRYYIETCKHCGHVEETLSSIDEKKKEPTQEEIERYEYDKKRFCLTDQQGQRYRAWKESMKHLDDQKKEQEANAEFFDKFAEVKKLNIAGLEKLLKPALKKAGYGDFHITMSPPAQQIILNFSVRDMEEKREEHDSRKTLKKTIEGILENKNWALTSEGVSYRLGLLDGRIRGYESKEDLEQLTKSRMKKQGKLVNFSKSKSEKYSSMFPDDIEL